MQQCVLCAFVVSCALGLYADDNPFVGRWKMNFEKSRFVGNTVVYEARPSDVWKVTFGSLHTEFKIDGKEHTVVGERKVTWVQNGDRSWEATWKQSDRILVTERIEISPDQKTMIVTGEGTTPSGEKIKQVTTYKRESAGAGLAGTWRSQEAHPCR